MASYLFRHVPRFSLPASVMRDVPRPLLTLLHHVVPCAETIPSTVPEVWYTSHLFALYDLYRVSGLVSLPRETAPRLCLADISRAGEVPCFLTAGGYRVSTAHDRDLAREASVGGRKSCAIEGVILSLSYTCCQKIHERDILAVVPRS